MAKFHGMIGYVNKVESKPGVWTPQTTVKEYYGDLVKNSVKNVASDSLNDGVSVSNDISIVADPYATANFHSMRYVEFMGAKWEIKSVDVRYPRLILTIGGVYNGK